MYICRALLKYGIANFSFGILEYCEIKDLMEREGYYFSLFKKQNVSLYNIATDPTAPMAGRNHSSETIQQMSEARLNMEGENPMLNKKHSDESRKIMSESKGGENNPMFVKITPLKLVIRCQLLNWAKQNLKGQEDPAKQ
jgi:group I intron endonuclease